MSEQVIATKLADALIVEAELALSPAMALPLGRRVPAGQGAVDWDWFRRFYGGLWVGGQVTLTSNRIRFAANSLNKIVRSGPMEFDVELRHVIEVTVRRGLFGNVIHVVLPGAVLQLRCLGARAFAEQIRDAIRDLHRP
ncbi:hypothetical protein LKO27_12565 [Tessaracoccus sp. OS52]|uniref:hypothetical protein n=1 Tax=Tessaracoccus sp. OS52 TaxID=2886691 RepID=UPI001D10AABA|nr:hypothetical protein [Tessaracoccus sp. OS52]MCC2594240.1 hypothetical protein [Tessaracoccus sp. OS52]